MKTKALFIVFLLSIMVENTYSQGLFKKLLKKDTSELTLDTLEIKIPEGVTYYPCSTIDDKYVITNSVTFSNLSPEQIFINLLLYTIEQQESGNEHFINIDFAQKKVNFFTEVGSKIYTENQTYYKYISSFSVNNQELSFLISEMILYNNNLFGEQKETQFENLQPTKKAKHKNYINEYSAETSIFLHNLFEYIKSNQSEAINHWSEITANKIVEGMNRTECLLSVGKPLHIRNNGNQIKWMVNNDFVVIFENEIVTKVIN